MDPTLPASQLVRSVSQCYVIIMLVNTSGGGGGEIKSLPFPGGLIWVEVMNISLDLFLIESHLDQDNIRFTLIKSIQREEKSV